MIHQSNKSKQYWESWDAMVLGTIAMLAVGSVVLLYPPRHSQVAKVQSTSTATIVQR